jgi:hypothetical protein
MASSRTVGDFSLVVGAPGGTLAAIAPDGDPAQRQQLATALEKEPEDRSTSAALAEGVEDASEFVGKIERAEALLRGCLEGKTLELEQLPLEIDALVDVLERLDRAGKHREALRMARALSGLLALLLRWLELVRSLKIALTAAQRLGDDLGVAWAKHELGTLQLAAGQTLEAERDLERARELREAAGDRAGLAATNHNLGSLCRQLRRMYREGRLVEPGRWRRRWRRVAVMAAAAAILLLLGGVAAGVVPGGNDDGPNDQANGEQERGGGTDGGGRPGGDPGTGPGGPAGSGNVVLVVRPTGDGQGAITSRPAAIRCPPDCRVERPSNSEILLTATASEGSVFAGWRGGGCSGRGVCRLGLGDDTTVTAAFGEAEAVTHALTVEAPQGGTVTSDPSGITCPGVCDAEFADGALVTLTATEARGYGLLNWAGACSGNGGCAVTMDEDKQVEATFAEQRTLTVNNESARSVTSEPAGISCPARQECSAQFPSGTQITLTAQDTYFSGAGCGGSTCKFALTQDQTVTAEYVPP